MPLILLLISGYFIYSLFTPADAAKNETWQGIFYPKGCLHCADDYVYSPNFSTYEECRNWNDTMTTSKRDKSSCNKGCEYKKEGNYSICNLVVRSWNDPNFPDSPTYKTYKKYE